METVSYCDRACLMEVNQGTIFPAKIPRFIDYSEFSRKIALLPDVVFLSTELIVEEPIPETTVNSSKL